MQLPYSCLPALFCDICRSGQYPGWFAKSEGKWEEFSGSNLLRRLQALFLAFRHLGIRRGDHVGLMMSPSPDWFLSDLAIQICGAVTVPLFSNIAEENFLFEKQDADIHILILELSENDSLLNTDLLPLIKTFQTIILHQSEKEYAAARHSDSSLSFLDSTPLFFDNLIQLGETFLKDSNSETVFNEAIRQIADTDIFSIIYTSGSTGKPKGVELSHRNMIVQFQALKKEFSLIGENERALSILPTAHIFERMVIYFYLFMRIPIYFGKDPRQLATLIKETKPTIMTTVPRLLERIYENILKVTKAKNFPAKIFLLRALRYAHVVDPSKKNSFLGKFFDFFVFKKIRNRLGGSFKYIISGSSALNKNICRFFLNLGFPICEGYGMTECSPVISLNTLEKLRPGSVGKPLEFLEIKFGEHQEILVRGESVFRQYHNLDRKPFFTEDGFFKTGDSGFFGSEGQLYLTGRLKEMLKTSTGKYVSPAPIENELCRLPLISAAHIIANNRKFVSAILFLRPEVIQKMIEETPILNFHQAIQTQAVQECIARHIAKTNKHLNSWEQIRKWIVASEIPSVENGMFTPTFKLRRRIIEQQYAEKIEALYQCSYA